MDADALHGDLLGAAIPEDLVETSRRVSGSIAAELVLSGTWRELTGAGTANLLEVSYVDAEGAPLPGLRDRLRYARCRQMAAPSRSAYTASVMAR